MTTPLTVEMGSNISNVTNVNSSRRDVRTKLSSVSSKLSNFEIGFAQLNRKMSLDEDREADPPGSTSTMASVANLVITMVGAGILNFPGMFATTGYLVTPCVLAVVALIVCEIGRVMNESINIIEARRRRSPRPMLRPQRYDDLMEAAFGPRGKLFSLFAMNGTLLLVDALYLILIGQTLQYLLNGWRWMPWKIAYKTCVVAMSTIMACLTLFDDMAFITRMANIGCVTCVVYVLTIATAGFRYGIAGNFPVKSENGQDMSFPVQAYDACPADWLAPFSVMTKCLLCFAYQPCIPTVRAEMENPERMGFSIKVACFSTFSVYALAGAGGYYGFGSKADRESVLNNMISDTGSKMPEGLVLSSAVALNLFVTFPILMNVVNRAAENALIGKYCAPVRMVLLALCVSIAIFMPYFNVLMGLIGAIPVCILLTLVPLVMFWKLVHDDGVKVPYRNLQIVWHCFVVLFGLLCLGMGSSLAFEDLRKNLEKGSRDPFWA